MVILLIRDIVLKNIKIYILYKHAPARILFVGNGFWAYKISTSEFKSGGKRRRIQLITLIVTYITFKEVADYSDR